MANRPADARVQRWQNGCRHDTRSAYKYVPALVLDHVNLIAEENTGLLYELQNFAKFATDKHVIRVFFSLTKLPHKRQFNSIAAASSAISRAFIFQVDEPEISDEQVSNFLV